MGSSDTNPFLFTNNFKSDSGDFHVTDVSLTLNDSPVDGLDTTQTSSLYYRNQVFGDCFNHNISPGVTLSDYTGGYFYVLFDLTTALEGNLTLVSPVVRSGLGRLSVLFNRSTTVEITVVALLEYASVLEIDKNRNIHTNYGT